MTLAGVGIGFPCHKLEVSRAKPGHSSRTVTYSGPVCLLYLNLLKAYYHHVTEIGKLVPMYLNLVWNVSGPEQNKPGWLIPHQV
jgi:hypothetical protein